MVDLNPIPPDCSFLNIFKLPSISVWFSIYAIALNCDLALKGWSIENMMWSAPTAVTVKAYFVADSSKKFTQHVAIHLETDKANEQTHPRRA